MNPTNPCSSPVLLQLNAAHEVERIAAFLRASLQSPLRRQGYVVAMSGGIDSSVVAALCVRAVGTARVHGLFLPERDSSKDCLRLSGLLAAQLGIQTSTEDITECLTAAGCYRRQVEAIRSILPSFEAPWRFKLVLANSLSRMAFRLSSLVVETPDGKQVHLRLTASAYRALVAATNFKQRIRKMMEYYYADALGYAVAGTPNLLEYDQGFFVKNGDGAADIKPIAHLYKSQVYQLAEYLEIPHEIRQRTPSTDTFSLPQTQEEFYFALPYDKMDICLFGLNHGIPPGMVAQSAGLSPEQVLRVYDDIDAKRKATGYLHMAPLLLPAEPTTGGAP
jgi:NAD+ synthase